MPVSTLGKTFSMVEESHTVSMHFNDNDHLMPPKLEQRYFEEISEMFQTIKRCEREEAECLRKVERIDRILEEARAAITKGREARDTLTRRNEFLQDKLEKRDVRIQQAIQYWKDYGFEVKQLSKDEDPFQKYQFVYTKLACAITLMYQDKKLEIVEQMPELLSTDLLTELNQRLTANCVMENGHIDYKLANIMIKKTLAPVAPKTSSHQSTETNNHTCT